MTSLLSARGRAAASSPRVCPKTRCAGSCCSRPAPISRKRRRCRRCSPSAASTIGAAPPGIPEFDWDFVNTDGAGALGGRSLRVPRGRLVGGTSMINATIAARGAPFDFDRWAAMGNKGWAWADLLPLFIAIENDVNFGDQPIHGRDGPIVIQRYRPQSWAPVNRAMYDACVELGVREAADLNAPDGQAGVVGADAAQPLQGSSPWHARNLHPERPRATQSRRSGRAAMSIAFFLKALAPAASPTSTAAASRRRRSRTRS